MNMLANPQLAKYSFDPNLQIENLWIDNINEINFDEFKHSVFRIGNEQAIVGNLIFESIEAENGYFDTINGRKTHLTTFTNQIITSDIFIDKIFSKDVEANFTNGVEFGKSVVTFENPDIEGTF